MNAPILTPETKPSVSAVSVKFTHAENQQVVLQHVCDNYFQGNMNHTIRSLLAWAALQVCKSESNVVHINQDAANVARGNLPQKQKKHEKTTHKNLGGTLGCFNLQLLFA